MNAITANSDTGLAEIVSRIMAGDPAAEEELVLRYRNGVSIIIDRITMNQSLTEDVFQETFRIALQKIRRGDVRQPERLSGFVCSVARNTAIDCVRRTRRTRNLEAVHDGADPIHPGPSQLDEILKQEKAAIVRQIICELKIKRDRDVLLRYFIAEEDKDKICADLNLTRTQFNSVIFRAITRFKELYLRAVDQRQR